VLDERLMDHGRQRETSASPTRSPSARSKLRQHFVDELRRAGATSPDPARAWDEGLQANDGGRLAISCEQPDPGLRPGRSSVPRCAAQLEVQVRRLGRPPGRLPQRRRRRRQAKKASISCTPVLRGLATCIQQQLFGELVAALQVA
jgi:hypothetical protein